MNPSKTSRRWKKYSSQNPTFVSVFLDSHNQSINELLWSLDNAVDKCFMENVACHVCVS